MVLTIGRPPPMDRGPERRPLSRAMGARPASAAMLRRSIWPSSGNVAMRVAATTGPTPGAACERPFSVAKIISSVAPMPADNVPLASTPSSNRQR